MWTRSLLAHCGPTHATPAAAAAQQELEEASRSAKRPVVGVRGET